MSTTASADNVKPKLEDDQQHQQHQQHQHHQHHQHDAVYFYGHGAGKPNKELSNFYKVPGGFEYNGFTFCTSEQALMFAKAMLMGDGVTALKIRSATQPLQAKCLGRKVKPWDQAKWDANCENLMRDILVAKFSNPAMKPKLLETVGKQIYEASASDKIWGIGISVDHAVCGAKHNGRNLLGKALMRAREILF